jgi:hypothetical protein
MTDTLKILNVLKFLFIIGGMALGAHIGVSAYHRPKSFLRARRRRE